MIVLATHITDAQALGVPQQIDKSKWMIKVDQDYVYLAQQLVKANRASVVKTAQETCKA